MISPNSTIGIFGSGQLGRMFAVEAAKLGYRVHTFSPDSDTPTGRVCGIETTADYEDLDAVRRFALAVDVITFEFENVPVATVEAARELADVRPGGDILYITQNRLREKRFLAANAIPHTPFRYIAAAGELAPAAAELGFPAVLKTAGFGYDGKGQIKLRSTDDLADAAPLIARHDCVLEAFVDFEKEISVVCARGEDGTFVHYGVIENDHSRHILDVSFAPAAISESSYSQAIDIARTIAETFRYIGTMCVEFFLCADGSVLVNEIAPRPHNSGHVTFGPALTSQFQQQVRAVCGLPLGSTEFYRPAAIANLLGDEWNGGEPNWAAALAAENVQLHLYGKADPRPGRKMGHLTATCVTGQQAAERVRAARSRLCTVRR